jgi:hypothetical protein
MAAAANASANHVKSLDRWVAKARGQPQPERRAGRAARRDDAQGPLRQDGSAVRRGPPHRPRGQGRARPGRRAGGVTGENELARAVGDAGMPEDAQGRPTVTSRESGPNATITTIPGRVPTQRETCPYHVGDLPPDIAQHITVSPGGCWLWQGPLDRDGYGRYRGDGAHRVVYRQLAGPIPDGCELDHLCHTRDQTCPGGKADLHRRCVYPADLEPVTSLQNSLRSRSFAAINAAKAECIHGHPYDLFGTYWRPNGHRDCRVCIRLRVAKYKRQKRQQALVTTLAPVADLGQAV